MKPLFIISALCMLQISCYKPYTASIDSDEETLVVEGMITDDSVPYQIILSYASPFYLDEEREPVKSALVYVTDDEGNYYEFREHSSGNYLSDPSKFTGKPGRTYTLHIEASDGEIYISRPQKLSLQTIPDTVYGEHVVQKSVNKFIGLPVTTDGAGIMADLGNSPDTLRPVRFKAMLLKLYLYELIDIVIYPGGLVEVPLLFFCWESEDRDEDINLAGNDYSLNYYPVRRHQVYFIEDMLSFEAKDYLIGIRQPDGSYKYIVNPERKTHIINHRILYLTMYTLNNESFLYYRHMDEQLRAEGRLFDPVATQPEGNIQCTTSPDRKVFGFFEASAVSYQAYHVGFRNPVTNEYSVVRIPCILPSQPDGCRINQKPPFWSF